MGVKRDIDSGRIDSLGRPIMVSGNSASQDNTQSKMSQIGAMEGTMGSYDVEDEWVELDSGTTIVNSDSVTQLGRQESYYFADQFSRCAYDSELSNKDFSVDGGDDFVNENWSLITKFLKEEYDADAVDDNSSDIEVEFHTDKDDYPIGYESMTPEELAGWIEDNDLRRMRYNNADLGNSFYDWVMRNGHEDELNF